MEHLIAQLRASPLCDLKPWATPPSLLPELPSEIRYFFDRFSGGRLFYDKDYPTPMFGCHLRLSSQSVAVNLGSDSVGGYCEGEQFAQLYAIAEYEETGDYTVAAVSTDMATYGYIYSLSYGLGYPTLNWSDVAFVAPSFSRWLAIHLKAWEVYNEDWREGLRLFGALIKQELQAIIPKK